MELEKIKEFIKTSKTKKEVIYSLGYKYNFRTLKKINDIIKNYNIDISHFKSSSELQKKYSLILKQCPKCSKEFETKSGGKHSKNFCSQTCANSRVLSDATKKKIGKKVKTSSKDRIITDKMIISWKENGVKIKEKAMEKILEQNFDSLSWERKRKRVIHEQLYCCDRCKNNEWMEEKIALEIEHRDGDNNNDIRNNLIALCPNCHSLTKTWRGRNKKNKRNKISDENLLKSLINYNFNMRQALIYVGLSPKGGNYKRCHKLKREYDESKNDERKQ